MREPNRKWIEGTVDTSKSHFRVTYGEMQAEARPVLSALVGQGDDEVFIVQPVSPTGEPILKDEIPEAVVYELNYYLIDHDRGPDPWTYLIHHATRTFANMYSNVHWIYYPESVPKGS